MRNTNRVLAFDLGRPLTAAELDLVAGAGETGTEIESPVGGEKTCDDEKGEETECPVDP